MTPPHPKAPLPCMHAQQCAVCSVQCAVCSVQCAVCSVQCAVCSVCSVCIPVLLEFSFIEVICQCKADPCRLSQLIFGVQMIQQCCAACSVFADGCLPLQPKASVHPILDQGNVMTEALGQSFQLFALFLQQCQHLEQHRCSSMCL